MYVGHLSATCGCIGDVDHLHLVNTLEHCMHLVIFVNMALFLNLYLTEECCELEHIQVSNFHTHQLEKKGDLLVNLL